MFVRARTILAEEFEELKSNILSHYLSSGQKASGRTGESLRVEVSEDEGTLFGRKAFGILETGRKAGKVPTGFQSIIRQWMADKGLKADPIPYKTNRQHKYTEQERGDRSLAFLIARKIRREGTRLFREGGRNDIYSNEIPKTKENIMRRLISIMKVEIASIKLNNEEI